MGGTIAAKENTVSGLVALTQLQIRQEEGTNALKFRSLLETLPCLM